MADRLPIQAFILARRHLILDGIGPELIRVHHAHISHELLGAEQLRHLAKGAGLRRGPRIKRSSFTLIAPLHFC